MTRTQGFADADGFYGNSAGVGLGLQLGLALEGKLDDELDQERNRLERAVRRGAELAGRELLEEVREDVRSSGLKNAGRLANTWRLTVYPRPGVPTLEPTVTINSRASLLVRAFEDGEVIRSKDGFFLAIPTDAAPKRDVLEAGATGGRGAKRGRRNLIRAAERRFGPLRFVYRRGRPSLLVATVRASTAKPGTFRRASATALRTGTGLVDLVLFVLVPQVRLPRLLRGQAILAAAADTWPSRLERHVSQQLSTTPSFYDR